MSSVNLVILIGHLGSDPTTRFTQAGDAVTTLSLATSERYTDRAGEKQEKTEWSRVVFFGKGGEVIAQYAKKGSLLFVEGKLSTRKWTDKKDVVHFSTEIIGSRFQFLGSGGKREAGGDEEEREPAAERATAAAAAPAKADRLPGGFDEMEDDIPF